jgi:mRNA interferase MazF
MKKGDIILISFPFTDLTGNKNRPAFVLVDRELDVTVAFISTQLKWQEATDVLLKPTEENGLKKESLLRLSKLGTIDKDLAIGKLGFVDNTTIKSLNRNLKEIFQLKA